MESMNKNPQGPREPQPSLAGPEVFTSTGAPYLTSPLLRASSAIILRAVKASSLTRLQEGRVIRGQRSSQVQRCPSVPSPRFPYPPLIPNDSGQPLQRSHISSQTHIHLLRGATPSVLGLTYSRGLTSPLPSKLHSISFPKEIPSARIESPSNSLAISILPGLPCPSPG